ncbi:allatostatin-A receptor-like [Diadema antillarum]|uniref:allatostatin-A receptor-like n=1 Tax=Diadema antillarum TaxID=105358 RepID=UPI003A8C28AE
MWCLVAAISVIVQGNLLPPVDAFSGEITSSNGPAVEVQGAGTSGILRSNLSWSSSAEMEETNQTGDTPKLDPLQWTRVFGWTWVNALEMSCACVGVLGNLLVILALRMQVGTIKHSTDILIGALAVSDLLTSISIMPLPLAVRVPRTPLGSLYCKFAYPRYFVWVPVHVSIYTLVGIAIERTIAIVSPLHFRSYVTTRKIYTYISTVCVLSFISCLYPVKTDVVNNTCKVPYGPETSGTIMFYLLMIRFGTPVTIMIVTQAATAWSLHRQSQHVRKGLSQATGVPSTHIRARNRITRLTFLIVLTYILTFAPHHVTAGVCVLQGKLYSYLHSPLHSALSVLICVNSCANPFIYASQYPRFRTAIRDAFKCKRVDNQNHPFFTSESNTFQHEKIRKSKD